MKIQILIDNPNSWIVPYAEELRQELTEMGHKTITIFEHGAVQEGDILCLLSCERKFSRLHLNRHNLVVHESDLPQGKGWSPVTWQVLEGRKRIPVTLFEASDEIDAGDIYCQGVIELKGDELLPEIKHQQGMVTKDLIKKFISVYPDIHGRPQQGESTYYPKRSIQDSLLNVNKSIKEQFNLLRVCDNERYPALFELNGVTYILKIEKQS